MVRRITAVIALALCALASMQLKAAHAATSPTAAAQVAAATSRVSTTSPIKHIVIIFQENHSFDNVLGAWCVQTARCDGTTVGPTGQPLGAMPDVTPYVRHLVQDQQLALQGKWTQMSGCANGACLAQFQPSQVPALTSLATNYVVSDRTFASAPVPSAGAHLLLAVDTLDGFEGDNPIGPRGYGWGCPSSKVTNWSPTGQAPWQSERMCVPYVNGSGTEVPAGSPVAHVPSIFDELQAKGASWTVYGPNSLNWNPCVYEADCWYTPQRRHTAPDITPDAQSGALPNISFVIPSPQLSQHNTYSMMAGDNYIASIVNAIEGGPDWSSTAILITYDDCGCFYDHVTPPSGEGFRVPMVIVSPYARPGFTDDNVASLSSMLTMIEHTFGLPALTSSDANAYDYSGAFNFAQTPLRPRKIRLQPLGPQPVGQPWDPDTDT